MDLVSTLILVRHYQHSVPFPYSLELPPPFLSFQSFSLHASKSFIMTTSQPNSTNAVQSPEPDEPQLQPIKKSAALFFSPEVSSYFIGEVVSV
jgi:hypothetical protein